MNTDQIARNLVLVSQTTKPRDDIHHTAASHYSKDMQQPDHFTTRNSTEFGQADGRVCDGEFIRTHSVNSRLKAKPLPNIESPYLETIHNAFTAIGMVATCLFIVGFVYWRFL